MTGSPRVIAAAVGGLVLLVQLSPARAQSSPQAVTQVALLASGSIGGVVQDEKGAPIPGAMVSAVGALGALGAKTATAVTDRGGRFEIRTLPPGPYLVRAHITGYVGTRGQIVEVRASAHTSASIALLRAGAVVPTPSVPVSLPVLAAGLGGAVESEAPAAAAPAALPASPAPQDVLADSPAEDDHSETAWRLRHLRRGILKDVTVPPALLADDVPETTAFGADGVSRSAGAFAGIAANLFAGIPFTGQFNLVTTGSFDSPKGLFSADNFSRSIAYVSLAAPAGDQADWSMRGALTQGDISSWFVAGAYTTRVPARHRFDLGMSYSTQRYHGGNPAALRDVSDGSRNVGALYGFDTFTITPAVAVTYGARYSRYDYLAASGLFSSRVELALSPGDDFRVNALASSRALAPGAEEFLPPIDIGLWLPPQRTFSSIVEGRPLQPQRTDHLAIQAERDFGRSTVTMRAFRQQVTDQLVTMFGVESPAKPRAQRGHYFVGNMGEVDATGWGAGFRTTIVSRVHGSVEYSQTSARWRRANDGAYLVLVAPSVARPTLDRMHDVSTAIETNVPETSTRVLVIYRLTNAGASGADRTLSDSRFDVQVHQSLPFMDFSTARWEMLLAVRNTFHEATVDSSVYDELLVVRPPKRVVGGLTLRF